MAKIKHSIISGIKSDLIIFILKIILGFGTIPIYLYFLDLVEFGIYIAVQSVISLLALADVGLGQYVVKKLSNKKYYDKHAYLFLSSVQVFQYLLAGCLLIIGIIGFYYVADFLNVDESIKEDVNWLFLFSWCAVVIKTCFVLIPAVLRAKSLLAYINTMNFLTLLLSVIINISFLSLGFGVSSLGLSLLIANVIIIFMMYLRLNKEVTDRFLFPVAFEKKYIFAGWAYMKSFQLLIMAKVAKSSLFVVFLSQFAGAQVVAVYNITNKMPIIFPDLMSRLSLNYFTHFSSLYEQGLMNELKMEYQKIFNIGIQCTFFILCSLFFLNELFISIWVGSEKFIGGDVFVFMLLNIGILLLNSFTGLIIQVSGEFKKTPLFALVEIVLLFTLSSFFYNSYGIEGLVFSLFLSCLPSFLYGFSVVRDILLIRYKDVLRDNLKNIIFMSICLSLIHFTLNKLISLDLVKLLVESVMFTLLFIITQWERLPENLRLYYRKLLK